MAAAVNYLLLPWFISSTTSSLSSASSCDGKSVYYFISTCILCIMDLFIGPTSIGLSDGVYLFSGRRFGGGGS